MLDGVSDKYSAAGWRLALAVRHREVLAYYRGAAARIIDEAEEDAGAEHPSKCSPIWLAWTQRFLAVNLIVFWLVKAVVALLALVLVEHALKNYL